MVDFNVFDALLDSTFVVDGDGRVIYCNEAAATLLKSSVRRLTGKCNLADHLQFSEPNLLPFTPQSLGRNAPTALIETGYTLPKVNKSGKTQLTVRAVDDRHWVFFLHDVSLEETLAAKYRAQLEKTEEYARNLEKLVEARTAELRAVNQTLNAILESLGQGFFTFNAEGNCGDVFTKACEDVLEGMPKARKVWDVLALDGKDQAQFKKWMETVFAEHLPFEDLKGLGPSHYAHKNHRHVVLDYFPIRRDKNEISEVVVVATDKTAEHEAQSALESERQYAAMVVKFLRNQDQFRAFLSSVKGSVAALESLAAGAMAKEQVAESFRLLHTLEGEAGVFSLSELRDSTRKCQEFLEPFNQSHPVAAFDRSRYMESLFTLKDTFENFLVDNDHIFHLLSGDGERIIEVPFALIREFDEQLEVNQKLRRKFRDSFFRVTFESRLKYFDGVLSSVAEKLGKRVKPLLIEGGGFKIYPEPYQAFFSSLVHAFRNAADHGLEDPSEREWAGKEPAGQVRVSISKAKGGFNFVVSDDGRGIDPKVIREKLKRKFPERDFSTLSDDEIIQNVALPGFSSRETIGEFSGRGVGLDALRAEVLTVGGNLNLKSTLGKGTSIEIFLPELDMKLESGSKLPRSA